jgi:hypothetical protein
MTAAQAIETKRQIDVKTPKLKAFGVTESDENTGGIVFATHGIVALRQGAAIFGSGEIYGWKARRAPWADAYAESRRVPMSVCVKHGWWIECAGCGMIINEGSLYDKKLRPSSVIGYQDSACYCCSACQKRDAKRKMRVKAAEAAGLDALRAEFRRRLPHATLDEVRTHAYACDYNGVTVLQQAIIDFTFPGQAIGPATLRLDQSYRHNGPQRPRFLCCNGDLVAFEAWLVRVRRQPAQDGGPPADDVDARKSSGTSP